VVGGCVLDAVGKTQPDYSIVIVACPTKCVNGTMSNRDTSRGYYRLAYPREVPLIELPFDWALKLLERAMEKLAERLGYWTIHQYKLLYEAMYDAFCTGEKFIIQLAKGK
jgi:hypothetical protein